MRLLSLVIVLISILHWSANGQQGIPDSVAIRDRAIFTVAEQPPVFPGGMAQLDEYIQKNIHYPSGSTDKPKRRGWALVTFIIDEEGRIEGAWMTKSVGPNYDAEALRLVKSMPNWIPAKQSGRTVAYQYNLPIRFSTEKK